MFIIIFRIAIDYDDEINIAISSKFSASFIYHHLNAHHWFIIIFTITIASKGRGIKTQILLGSKKRFPIFFSGHGR